MIILARDSFIFFILSSSYKGNRSEPQTPAGFLFVISPPKSGETIGIFHVSAMRRYFSYRAFASDSAVAKSVFAFSGKVRLREA